MRGPARGPGAPTSAPKLSPSGGTAGGGQTRSPARAARHPEPVLAAASVSGSPAPPRAPSSFSELFRGSHWAPRPPAGDVTMVQHRDQWAVLGAGSVGQWR